MHRLTKENRLADAASFDRVFKGARRSRDRWFTVLCRHNRIDRARLGLAISKKHCRGAAARNRLKRIVRESFRHHQESLSGLDIVVMNRPPAASAGNAELFSSLETHWQACAKKQAVT